MKIIMQYCALVSLIDFTFNRDWCIVLSAWWIMNYGIFFVWNIVCAAGSLQLWIFQDRTETPHSLGLSLFLLLVPCKENQWLAALKDSKELFALCWPGWWWLGGPHIFATTTLAGGAQALVFGLRSWRRRWWWRTVLFVIFFHGADGWPFVLFPTNVGTVPRPAFALHVRNVLGLDRARLQFLLGIVHWHEMIRLALLQVGLKGLQRSRFESTRNTVGTQILFRLVLLLFGILELLPLLGGHSIGNVSDWNEEIAKRNNVRILLVGRQYNIVSYRIVSVGAQLRHARVRHRTGSQKNTSWYETTDMMYHPIPPSSSGHLCWWKRGQKRLFLLLLTLMLGKTRHRGFSWWNV